MYILLFMGAPICFGDIVDIKDQPIPIPDHGDAIKMKGDYSRGGADGRVTVQEFTAFMKTPLGSFPGASLLVVEPTATFLTNEWADGEPNWEQLLRSYTDAGITCTISTDAGFLEVSYEKEPRSLLKASLAKGIVPPLTLIAEDGPQALAVWAIASDLMISYDQEAMEREAARAEVRKEAIRDDLAESGFYPEPGEIEREILQSRPAIVMEGGESIAEMMQELAFLSGCIASQDGDTWTIRPPEASEAEAAVAPLMAQLADEVYDHGSGPAASALARIGEPAVPALAAKLNAQTYDDNPYMYNTVASILSRIPCDARDTAFLKELERYSAEPTPPFLSHWYGVTMVESLSDVSDQAAIPLLQKLAAKQPPDEVATAARIALSKMGAAPAAAPASALLKVDQAVADQIKKSNQTETFDVLTAVVDSGFQPYGVPLEVTKFTEDADKVTYSGNLRDGNGTWSVNVIKRDDGYIIKADYYCGNLCGKGFVGRAEKKDDRWLIVEWKGIWVS